MTAHPKPTITAEAMNVVFAAIEPADLDPEVRDRLDVLRMRAAAGQSVDQVWPDLVTLTHRIPFADLGEIWRRIGEATEAERTADHRFTWDIWDWRAESALMDDPS